MILPIPQEYWNNVTQDYGVIDCVNYPKTCRHIGTDFAVPIGTPIVAIKDCEITRVSYSTVLGYWCEVKIDDWYMVCLHLRERPKVGLYTQGQTLAIQGATGRIHGVHSHLEGWTIPRDISRINKENWNTITFDIKTKVIV